MPDVDVERYLEAVSATARDVLGTGFVGAYAAGSLALNGFDPRRSDFDIALVCAGPLTNSTKLHLVARLRNRALPCPARGLEIVAYTKAVAHSGTAAPGFELELNDGPNMAFRQTLDPADRPAADGDFWYGLDRSILHQSGRVLAGPPAREVFSELPDDELRRLLVESLRWRVAGKTTDTDEAVLGACRALVRHRDGTWLAKVDAGRRLLVAGYEPARTIEQAIAARSGHQAPGSQAARLLQNQVLKEIVDPTTARRCAEGSR